MFRGKKESCRKQQEAGGRKTGLFEEELAKRMEKVDVTKAVTRQGAT